MDDIRGGTGDTLRDILELLYTASERFFSIQISMRTWYDDAGCERARRRWKAAQAPGNVARLGPSMEAARGDANGRTEWVSHLWQQGTQWRYEGSMWDGAAFAGMEVLSVAFDEALSKM